MLYRLGGVHLLEHVEGWTRRAAQGHNFVTTQSPYRLELHSLGQELLPKRIFFEADLHPDLSLSQSLQRPGARMDRVVARVRLEGKAEALPVLHDSLSQRPAGSSVGVSRSDDFVAEGLPGQARLVELNLHPVDLRARGRELLPHAPVEPVDHYRAIVGDERDVVARGELERLASPPSALDGGHVQGRILLLILREVHDGAIRAGLGPALAELLLKVRLPVSRHEQLSRVKLDSIGRQRSIVIVDDPLGLDDISCQLSLLQDLDTFPFKMRSCERKHFVVDSMRLHKYKSNVHGCHELQGKYRSPPRHRSSSRACKVVLAAGG
mmetsp:Transcript_38149/g.120164  ORF Transcript_38149/g.120164 Transcript_38149/m.120164 type:complete len:323 (+) Transcript_38149:2053-3021(+)